MSSGGDGVPLASPVNRPFWLASRWVLGHLLRPVAWLRGWRVEGGERLPRHRRAMILVANHAAFIDSVVFILALGPRFTVCGAKPRLFRNARLRALMALANILKVDGKERYLRDCATLLAAGEILLIYPEMGRFPDGLGEFQTWAAEVALAAGVPILPCYVAGTTRGQQGPPRLMVGHGMEPVGDAHSLTTALRRAILALAPDGSAPEGRPIVDGRGAET